MNTDSTSRQIADLRRRVEEIAEELRQVRQAFALPLLPDWVPPLTPREEEVLRLLMSRALVTLATFEAVIDSESLDPDNMLKIYMMKLRKKLLPFGIEIECRRALGYALTRASRALLLGAAA